MKGERNPVRTTAGVQGQEDEPPAASGAERGGFNVGGAGTLAVVCAVFFKERRSFAKTGSGQHSRLKVQKEAFSRKHAAPQGRSSS